MTDFESRLETEFRWPTGDDRPFTSNADSDENATILQGRRALFMMVEGYKLGADTMVERASQGQWERDTLVYPIIFNYRHYIELSLKSMIATLGGHVDVDSDWASHDLGKLWPKFLAVQIGFGLEDPDREDGFVEDIIAEFAKIDPRSFAFRYPYDRRGRPLPTTYDKLDLHRLKDVMDGLRNYFIGTSDYLYSLTDGFDLENGP